jgi:hypothetical protein
MMNNSSNNNFLIKYNDSEFAKLLPEKWIEPLTIIARIKGYDGGVDEYIVELIRDSLEMFADARDELGEHFEKYMQNIMKKIPIPGEEEKEEDEESEEEESQEKPPLDKNGANDVNQDQEKEKEKEQEIPNSN